MSETSRPLETAVVLRQSFDRSFSEAPRATAQPPEQFLAIRVGGDAYAVRLAETAGLIVDRKVIALPSFAPDLLGIAGLRGNIVAVYDLGALLGYPRAPAGRWLLLIGGTETTGLAFADFEGHLQSAQGDLAVPDRVGTVRDHVREVVRIGEVMRPIINLVSIAEAIKRRVRSAGPSVEREVIDGS